MATPPRPRVTRAAIQHVWTPDHLRHHGTLHLPFFDRMHVVMVLADKRRIAGQLRMHKPSGQLRFHHAPSEPTRGMVTIVYGQAFPGLVNPHIRAVRRRFSPPAAAPGAA